MYLFHFFISLYILIPINSSQSFYFSFSFLYFHSLSRWSKEKRIIYTVIQCLESFILIKMYIILQKLYCFHMVYYFRFLTLWTLWMHVRVNTSVDFHENPTFDRLWYYLRYFNFNFQAVGLFGKLLLTDWRLNV